MRSQQELREWFFQALVEPPLDMLDRLEREENDYIWGMGASLRRLAGHILSGDPEPEKVFLCDPFLGEDEKEPEYARESSHLKSLFRGNCLERLDSFPDGTFDVCLSTWMLGTVPAGELISLQKRLLGEGGRAGFMAMKDGTPEEPIRLFQETVREVTGRTTDVKGRGHMEGAPSFRRVIRGQGLGHERVWEDTFSLEFQGPREVFEIVKSSLGAGQPEEVRDQLKEIEEVFCGRLREEKGEHPDITYAYLGATAVAPG